MTRHATAENPDNRTAPERIADVIQWADRQGFSNIADDLRHALALLPDEEHGRGRPA